MEPYPPEGGSPFIFSLKTAKNADRIRTGIGQYSARIRTRLGQVKRALFAPVKSL
jgi:hypothetical protein